ncbi:MAG TPA: adenylyltransferase/cytidyltransferase family protein [Candidatus Paceibacterota bacterium]
MVKRVNRLIGDPPERRKRTVEKRIWPKRTRIMVFGTFDGLHLGHLNLFKQARRLAKRSFLIVSIARDKNVFKIKGKYPYNDERKRMALIKESRVVDKVILSGIKNHIPHIIKIHPDVIALGYDQKAYVKNLKKDLSKKGISVKVVRLKPYKEKIYKNRLLNGS